MQNDNQNYFPQIWQNLYLMVQWCSPLFADKEICGQW